MREVRRPGRVNYGIPALELDVYGERKAKYHFSETRPFFTVSPKIHNPYIEYLLDERFIR